MRVLLLTDTHFGVKQNSITWLNSQLDFIYKQFIPYIESINDYVRVIHLGDVFDSRSSISPLVATKVRQMFIDISKLSNVEVIDIIAGNHDFYSPNSDEIDSISLTLQNIDKVTLHTKNMDFDIGLYGIFVPWYKWFDQDKLQEYITLTGAKYVFTHADIIMEPVKVKGVKVYSGHIHIPNLNSNKNLYNLGSCYALNFADANQNRMFYEFDIHTGNLIPIANNISIKFWRLYNEEIFKSYNIKDNDYVELYINQNNMTKADYNKVINEYTKKYKNIWIIPQIESNLSAETASFEGYDIEKITKEMIPDPLKGKFNMILNSL